MGTIVVTGAAGFIGSTLCTTLLDQAHRVRGIDVRSPRTDQTAAANLAAVIDHPAFELLAVDLLDTPLADVFSDADVVVHLAGQPGVQSSWGLGFANHVDRNVHAAQVVLEATLAARVGRTVLASSSSVYGHIARGRAVETARLAPRSPYGVTKAAAEQLTAVYARRGLSAVSLRYFTVYGPRQRPDMAFHRIVAAALGGPAFPLRGDGRQVREFTYVDDAVAATVAATTADLPPGWVGNVGGGEPTSLNAAIALVEELSGRPVPVQPAPPAPGDPDRTAADLGEAEAALGWRPTTELRTGLRAQLRWQGAMVGAGGRTS
jgi:nucleoside-diphosphate-sugar epimerase